MWMIIIFWLILAIPLLALMVWIYRRVTKFSRIAAVFVIILTIMVLTLIWPIPIHGGFTIFAEILYDEWRSGIRQREITRQEQAREMFDKKSVQRFSGALNFQIQKTFSEGWSEVIAEGGERGWLNTKMNLIWSQPMPITTDVALPPLETAIQRCRDLAPHGKWALASEAEHALRWQNKGETVMGQSSFSMMSYIDDELMQIEFPTYAKKNLSVSGQMSNQAAFAVYCVARTVDAPAGGYRKKDLSLDLWNAYQLSKL